MKVEMRGKSDRERGSMRDQAKLKRLGRLQQQAKMESLFAAAGLVAILEDYPFQGEPEFVDRYYLQWKQSVNEFRRASKAYFALADLTRAKRKGKPSRTGGRSTANAIV